jgi:hypothetical protein
MRFMSVALFAVFPEVRLTRVAVPQNPWERALFRCSIARLFKSASFRKPENPSRFEVLPTQLMGKNPVLFVIYMGLLPM